jgi:hypothetical protein
MPADVGSPRAGGASLRGPQPRANKLGSTLSWSVLILSGETVALIVLLGLLVYDAITAPAGTPHGALAVTLYTAFMAGVLGLLSWALWRHKAWARGPAIVLQLLALPIGYSMVSSGLAWLGIPVLLAGLGGAGLLLAPPTRAALGIR